MQPYCLAYPIASNCPLIQHRNCVSHYCVFQDVQRERTTFVSSLLPLLTEYSLQPQVSDAQSIVSSVKVCMTTYINQCI